MNDVIGNCQLFSENYTHQPVFVSGVEFLTGQKEGTMFSLAQWVQHQGGAQPVKTRMIIKQSLGNKCWAEETKGVVAASLASRLERERKDGARQAF